MTRTTPVLAIAGMLFVLTALPGPAQADSRYQVAAGGDQDWGPKTGAVNTTSADKLEVTGTMADVAANGGATGVDAVANYHLASGPGIVRASIAGTWTVPSGLAYPFNPSLQAVSTTELTVSGPDGDIPVSLNLHVDGFIASPVCNGRDTCGAEEVYIGVSPPAGAAADFFTIPDSRGNTLGLAFDAVPGGFRVHGDVTSATFSVRANTPTAFTITLSLSGRYAASSAAQTFAGSFDDAPTMQQVSFAPVGPVLGGIPPGYTVSGPGVVDNRWTDPFAPPSGDVVVTDCADPALASLTAVTGSLIFRHLSGCAEIALPNLASVGGDIVIEDTDAVRIVIRGPLTVAGGVDIVDNDATTGITVGTPDAGGVTIGGSSTIINNGAATVNIGDATSVGGSVDVESAGDGMAGTTGGDGTDVTILGGVATMHVGLPKEAFTQPVDFTITRHFDDSPEQGIGADGADALVDPIATYEFDFEVPTLNADATLDFVIDLAALDAVERASLLNALASGTATIVGKGDDMGAQYRAFALCAEAQTPAADGCVAVTFLAADGTPTTGNPAFVRFDGVVGHFSTYGVAIVSAAGQQAAALPVPTMPRWMLAMLASIVGLAGAGALAERRRRPG
jgi:hypothetical protein